MPRVIPEGRLAAVIDAATAVFIENGYRRTQMADVAAALGLGKGTLYGYVESKEALFFLAARYSDLPVPEPFGQALPIATPAPGQLLTLFAKRAQEVLTTPILTQALDRTRAPDILEEFTAVVREAYTTLSAHRVGIKLLDHCAIDIPELREAWRSVGRGAELSSLERYVELRCEAGQLLPQADRSLAARMILETLMTWAVHIHWDRNPRHYEAEAIEQMVIASLIRSFVSS